MDKDMNDIKNSLKGFERVWARVNGSRSAAAPPMPAVMPQKSRKPKRRFDPR